MKLFNISYDARNQKVQAQLDHAHCGYRWVVGMDWSGLQMDQRLFQRLNAYELHRVSFELRMLFESSLRGEELPAVVWIDRHREAVA